MGGEFGGEWIQAYAWPSPFAVDLKLSQHCSLAILQYKTGKKKKSWTLLHRGPTSSGQKDTSILVTKETEGGPGLTPPRSQP